MVNPEEQPGRADRPVRLAELRFGLNWLLASAAGFLVGLLAATVLEHLLGFSGSLAAMFGITGAALGLAQWVVLRRLMAGTGYWALASAAGWAVAGLVSDLLLAQVEEYPLLAVLAAGGLLAGLLQWLLLRRQVARAGWWPVVSLLTWSISFVLTQLCIWMLVAAAGIETDLLGFIALLGLLLGAFAGFPQGFFLARLRRTRRPADED